MRKILLTLIALASCCSFTLHTGAGDYLNFSKSNQEKLVNGKAWVVKELDGSLRGKRHNFTIAYPKNPAMGGYGANDIQFVANLGKAQYSLILEVEQNFECPQSFAQFEKLTQSKLRKEKVMKIRKVNGGNPVIIHRIDYDLAEDKTKKSKKSKHKKSKKGAVVKQVSFIATQDHFYTLVVEGEEVRDARHFFNSFQPELVDELQDFTHDEEDVPAIEEIPETPSETDLADE